MSLIAKFLSIFEKRKSITVNQSPLYFSETAIEKIKNHLENRPANVKSAFKVSVVYQKEKIQCQVGFDDYKLIRKTLFEYPVPLIIAEQDELFLRGAYIDYHEEEAAYFYYPNVHLEVLDRSGGFIFLFYIDRYVISADSPIQTFALAKENFENSMPYLLKLLFETKMVESVYLEKNSISAERVKEIDKDHFEKEIAETILSYFEKCGYSLYIKDLKIEARQFEK